MITDMSVLSMIQLLSDGPYKEELLQNLAIHSAKPYQQVKYFVHPDQTVYQLSEAQSSWISSFIDPYAFTRIVGPSAYPFISRAPQEHIAAILQVEGATKLGSLDTGVIIGDESTYEVSGEAGEE